MSLFLMKRKQGFTCPRDGYYTWKNLRDPNTSCMKHQGAIPQRCHQ